MFKKNDKYRQKIIIYILFLPKTGVEAVKIISHPLNTFDMFNYAVLQQ